MSNETIKKFDKNTLVLLLKWSSTCKFLVVFLSNVNFATVFT